MAGRIQEILRRRELIKNLVARQLKVRYKNSFLGFFWSLFNPFFMMLIFWVVFSTIWKRFPIVNYKAYLICGLFPWYFFSGALSDSVNCIVGNVSLVKKVYFPRVILPLSAVLTNLVNFLLSLIVLFGMLIIWGLTGSGFAWLGTNLLFLPLVLLVEVLLALGLALFLAALNVFYRDTEHMLQVILFGGLFLTPAMYPYWLLIPGRFHTFYFMNPMAGVIKAYQDILWKGQAPELMHLVPGLLYGLGLVVLGYLYLDWKEGQIADQL